MLPSPWREADAGVALIRNAHQDKTERMLGVLFTGWSTGGSGEWLLAAFQGREDFPGVETPTRRPQVGRQIAETIKAGVKELDALAKRE